VVAGKGRARKVGIACIALATLFVAPTVHHTVWSAYQKLVGQEIPHGYSIDISDTFYQAAFDLRPETIAQLGFNPLPHYSFEFAGRPNLDNVLVVGARQRQRRSDRAARRGEACRCRGHRPRHRADGPGPPPGASLRQSARARDHRRRPPCLQDSAAEQLTTKCCSVSSTLTPHSAPPASALDNYVFTQESFSDAARLVRPAGPSCCRS
jgi:hypothetical protein